MHRSASRFRAPLWLRGRHAQTLWVNYARRPLDLPRPVRQAESHVIDTPDGDRLRAHWWWIDPDAPVLLVLHGLTGCAEAPQVVGLAIKAARRGFNVVRADLRNASGDTPSIGVGHAGRSEDVSSLLTHLEARAPGATVAIAGYSLGGNVTLKAVGEMGPEAPTNLAAVAVVSVPIDLDLSCRAIDGPGNWFYRHYFLKRLGQTVDRRRRRHPGVYPDLDLGSLRTIRGFDDAIVAPVCGFADAADYYRQSSSLAVIASIRVPTLLVQSRDDPFIPFDPFEDNRLRSNPSVSLRATARGGHVGFYAASAGGDPDRYWAESRVIEHCARHAGVG